MPEIYKTAPVHCGKLCQEKVEGFIGADFKATMSPKCIPNCLSWHLIEKSVSKLLEENGKNGFYALMQQMSTASL